MVLGHKWFRSLIGLLALTAAGCSDHQFGATPVSRLGSLDKPYTLHAGDKIRVDVFGESNLSSNYEIPVGTKEMPAGGSIKVGPSNAIQAGGKTLRELEAEITSQLANGYLKDPKVTVTMVSYRPIWIIGEVNKPGAIDYVPGMTVLNVVSAAQGFTYRADEKSVDIVHLGATDAERVPLTVAEPVQPGDQIRIRERKGF